MPTKVLGDTINRLGRYIVHRMGGVELVVRVAQHHRVHVVLAMLRNGETAERVARVV